ncbi:MAG: hypothetical protein OEM38_11450 [Gammaproteobacteria bacterium]|nr:hypothetical protein [Gammaproteobacteria bacterium]
MIKLTETVNAWEALLFADTLQDEIKKLSVDQLHLQRPLAHGRHVIADCMKIVILSTRDDMDYIYAKVGIFYIATISDFQSDDGLTSIEEKNEYCELMFNINKLTAETEVVLLP